MDASTVAVTLTPVPAADLPALAEGLAPPSLDGRFVEGAPIPPHVAARVLGQLAAGKPMHWVGKFYIIDGDGRCIGACGFRHVPHGREVELGYHLAPASHGRGHAAAALRRLLDIAAASGEVDTVLAQIRPDNAASSRLAQRAGFVAGATAVDEGEHVVQWRLRLAPAAVAQA